MSVLSYLSNLSSEAILSDTEKSNITNSINILNSRIVNDFGDRVTNQFRFGSSTRSTILPREFDDKSDIDYMIVFRDTDKSTQTYLDRLKQFAEKWYSSSDIKQSSPTIVLELNHIKFDLVPAITNYSSSTFQIPAPQSSYLTWIQTDPTGFNANLTRKNQELSSLIKPVIRLAKRWNVKAGKVFESYVLEQDIVNMGFYTVDRNIKSYLFHAVPSLTLPWDAAQWRKDRLERAKTIINNTKAFESNNQPTSAENEIAKLF